MANFYLISVIMNERSAGLPFAGKEAELKKIKDALSKPGLSVVAGRRGSGRTAFIRQLGLQFAGNRQYRFFYADVAGILNPADFILSLAKQTLGSAENGQVKQLRELSNYFTYLRPVINFNRAADMQQMDFVLDENYKADFTLEQLFTYLARQAPKVIIVLDDVQDVRHFRDQQFLRFIPDALKQHTELRVLLSVAESRNVRRWFENSQENLLKPSFHFTHSLPDYDELAQAISEYLKLQNKKLSKDVAGQLIDWCRGSMCLLIKSIHAVSVSAFKQPDAWQTEQILQQYLQEQRGVFLNYQRLLTANQWLLLRGIAREQGAKMVMGGEFVKKYGLGSPSSVQTALDAIFEKELVYEEEGRLYLQDVSLSRWMELNS